MADDKLVENMIRFCGDIIDTKEISSPLEESTSPEINEGKQWVWDEGMSEPEEVEFSDEGDKGGDHVYSDYRFEAYMLSTYDEYMTHSKTFRKSIPSKEAFDRYFEMDGPIFAIYDKDDGKAYLYQPGSEKITDSRGNLLTASPESILSDVVVFRLKRHADLPEDIRSGEKSLVGAGSAMRNSTKNWMRNARRNRRKRNASFSNYAMNGSSITESTGVKAFPEKASEALPFKTIVKCKCGSEKLKLEENKKILTCERCGYSDFASNVHGIDN